MRLINDPAGFLEAIFHRAGLSDSLSSFLTVAILIAVILSLSYIVNQLVKFFIRKVVHRIVRRTNLVWDDVFLANKVFTRLSHLAPAFVLWVAAEWALSGTPDWMVAIQKLSYIYALGVIAIVINSLIESLHQLYLRKPMSSNRNIKGYIQLAKILVAVIFTLLIVSVVFQKDVSSLLIGLGGMMAVLILVFQDTILGFVASIQLAGNDMVKIGDWISMPSRGIDGDVIDLSLHTVKVQNFDKTIGTVPTYALIKESFQNWSGMFDAGGRRIKRAIRIEMKSIRFLDEELRNKLYRIQILRPYIDAREEEIRKYNEQHGVDDSSPANGRRMTNVGTFRAYAQAYLSMHPNINTDMTFMVRQLSPDEKGLPIEIYVFTRSTVWAVYESIQSDIFDHLLAVVREFDLRVFEYPTDIDSGILTAIGDEN